MSGIHFLGDWGGTRLRLWRLDESGVTGRRQGPGIAGLGRPPREVLLEHLAPWLGEGTARLTLCGMAGARGGLREVPYVTCPTGAGRWTAAATRFELDRIAIVLAAGCACERAPGLRDLMRGEETQVFGAMRHDAALSTGRHLVVLPGTHSKWVTVEDGAIVGFRTFLTGELFARLRGSTLLPDDTTGFPAPAPGDEDRGFRAGLDTARVGGELLSDLFLARSAQVDAARSPAWAAGFLSGLLVGAECAGMTAGASPIRIVGTPALSGRYLAALRHFGMTGKPLDSEACTLAGLELADARV